MATLLRDERVGGDFRVLRLLREGGMGEVWVAEQVSTGASVALKVMHPQLVPDARMRERFILEAQIGSRIRSDHVVRVLAAGVDAERPFLAMELVEGADLAVTLDRRGPLPLDDVREIMGQLAHALGAAHDLGIVHRDLKPENLLLSPPRCAGLPFTLKVLDFGIAKLVAEARTSTTAALGTPLWMAPEQSKAGDVSPATDVWAMGLIAFRLLTGAYYWRNAYDESPSPEGLIREIVFSPLEPASRRAARRGKEKLLPVGFDDWFRRCVAREPADRYRNARRAAQEFEAFFAHRPRLVEPRGPSGVEGARWIDAVTEQAVTEQAERADPIERTALTEGEARTLVMRSPVVELAAVDRAADVVIEEGLTKDLFAPGRTSRRWAIGATFAVALALLLVLALRRPHVETSKDDVDACVARLRSDRSEQESDLEIERRARASAEARLKKSEHDLASLRAALLDARLAVEENAGKAEAAELRLRGLLSALQAAMKDDKPPCECPTGMFCPCE